MQLDHWLQFVPRSQLLVLGFHQLARSPVDTLTRIARFALSEPARTLTTQEWQIKRDNSHYDSPGAVKTIGCAARAALESVYSDFGELLPGVINRPGAPPEQPRWETPEDWGERATCHVEAGRRATLW